MEVPTSQMVKLADRLFRLPADTSPTSSEGPGGGLPVLYPRMRDAAIVAAFG